MKKIIFILFLFCFACGSSDDSYTSTLEVSVNQNATTLEVDQILTLMATANETIDQISFSKDGGTTFNGSYGSSEFDKVVNLYLDFDTLGPKTIVVRVKNKIGDVVDTVVNVTVEKGNAVQLKSVKLNSFFDMGNTWDSEYPKSNPNHLADVFFVLVKPKLNAINGKRDSGPSSSLIWYRSETRDNEINLNWNLQNEELYINVSELRLFIDFADDDGGGNVQDLMMGPPYVSLMPFLAYIDAKPSTITVTEPDIDLEYEIGIDW